MKFKSVYKLILINKNINIPQIFITSYKDYKDY